jgi:hypothetical protein
MTAVGFSDYHKDGERVGLARATTACPALLVLGRTAPGTLLFVARNLQGAW